MHNIKSNSREEPAKADSVWKTNSSHKNDS